MERFLNSIKLKYPSKKKKKHFKGRQHLEDDLVNLLFINQTQQGLLLSHHQPPALWLATAFE